MTSFGDWIRLQRQALDLTQQALAERVGCSLAAIRKIESDERRPSRQIAARLADVLDVPASQHDMFLEAARGVRSVEHLLLGREPINSMPSGTVTILFTDIEGSTLLSQLQPEAMKYALARHHRILRNAIESNDGHVFQIVGDSFTAAFDNAPNALEAALDVQRALREEPWDKIRPIRVRMGLHTGVLIKANARYGAGIVEEIHIRNIALAGVRNRASVLLNWAWGYFTWDRGPRIIMRRDPSPDLAKTTERAKAAVDNTSS